MIRTFIAVTIPADIKKRISAYQRQLREYDVHIRWVKPVSMHLTLKFLGDTAPERIPAIADAVKDAAAYTPPFSVTVGGCGCFPHIKRPRVIWIGITAGDEQLCRVAADLENSLERIGHKKDNRPYSPHITLGRIKSQRNIQSLIPAMDQDWQGGTFSVDHITVMKSELNPAGAVHKPLHTIELEGK